MRISIGVKAELKYTKRNRAGGTRMFFFVYAHAADDQLVVRASKTLASISYSSLVFFICYPYFLTLSYKHSSFAISILKTIASVSFQLQTLIICIYTGKASFVLKLIFLRSVFLIVSANHQFSLFDCTFPAFQNK